MPARKTVMPQPAPNPHLVRARTEGLQILNPLRGMVQAVHITNEEEYLQADGVLLRIAQARALWKTKLEPISAPIERAMKELKLSLTGVKSLNDEVDGPLATFETTVKSKMRTFKIEEAHQIRGAEEAQRAETLRLQREEEEARRKEEAARTPQMKAKLAAVRANLQTAVTASQIEPVQTAVRGVSSVSRSVRKPKITNLGALIKAIQDYEPQAELYKMGTPPLSLIDPEGEILTAINKIYQSQPGVVASWPGISIIDDIVIARK